MGNLTDFYVMAKYESYTDRTVSYMQQYLYELYETKDMFLCFRTNEKTKNIVAEAHKNLLKEQSS